MAPRSTLSVVLPITAGVAVLLTAAVLSESGSDDHGLLARRSDHANEVPHPLLAAVKYACLAIGLGAVVISALQLLAAKSKPEGTASEEKPKEEKPASPVAAPLKPLPKPVLSPANAWWAAELGLSPGTFFGVDVECAATGKRHGDRAPCRVALVSWDGQVLLDVVVRVENLVSALTPVTGLTREQIETSPVDLLGVRELIRQCCGPGAVLVGQSVQHDLQWLRLRPGVDYGSSIDLAEVFSCWPESAAMPRVFSLHHESLALLGWEIQSSTVHSPIEDAQVSMQLLLQCACTTDHVKRARMIMGQTIGMLPPRPRPPPRVDDVCMGIWSKTCNCDPAEKELRKRIEAERAEAENKLERKLSDVTTCSGGTDSAFTPKWGQQVWTQDWKKDWKPWSKKDWSKQEWPKKQWKKGWSSNWQPAGGSSGPQEYQRTDSNWEKEWSRSRRQETWVSS